MERLILGALLGAVTAPNLQFGALPTVLALLAALGGLGALVSAIVTWRRAGSERDVDTSTVQINGVKMMEVLFEKQRDINRQEIEERNNEIADLRRRIARADGDRDVLQARLRRCELDKTLLENQIRGLEQTIDELHRRMDTSSKPPARKRPRPPQGT